MSLPMLINGADCGPLNPLQSLSKRFEADHGIQHDHFTSHAGSSQVFRTAPPQAGASGIQLDAAQFFQSDSRADMVSPFSVGGVPVKPFDMGKLGNTLPSAERTKTPLAHSRPSQWATDFATQHHDAPAQLANPSPAEHSVQQGHGAENRRVVMHHSGPVNAPMMFPRSPTVAPAFLPLAANQQKSVAQPSAASWDQLFTAHEQSQSLQATSSSAPPLQSELASRQTPVDADDLSRTAGLLLEAVQHERNPKFQNSAFLGLMRRVRDREMIINGQDFVENDGTPASFEAKIDVKGKGRAYGERPQVTFAPNPTLRVYESTDDRAEHLQREQAYHEARDELLSRGESEDPNDAYFRQENEEYIGYWSRANAKARLSSDQQRVQMTAETSQADEWDRLQADWEAFEATASGIKPLANYTFQANNPYVLGSLDRTRQHSLHSDFTRSPYESALEMEALVQRNPTNARAWYELGVKQQENEREKKAIDALRRALELDPSHLPSWIALAVSYTNEGNRQGAHHAVEEWVTRHREYADTVKQYFGQSVLQDQGSRGLMECLVALARSAPDGKLDADVQIALAVLLNTDEEYGKAQDCFRAALSVRPEDWLLYNRVGATLANSGRAEEALGFYARALELNPMYIRARFNLGISCINLRRYMEGAQHILDALNFQVSDAVKGDDTGSRGVTSSALWDTLKTACLHLQRVDFATMCDNHDLDGLWREFQRM